MSDTLDDREINRQIAEFMGWSDLEWRDAGWDSVSSWPKGWYGTHPLGLGYVTTDYACSMDDLIPVIEKLREDDRYLQVAVIGDKSYAADLYNGRDKWLAKAMADTMAMAICLVILSYLGNR